MSKILDTLFVNSGHSVHLLSDEKLIWDVEGGEAYLWPLNLDLWAQPFVIYSNAELSGHSNNAFLSKHNLSA